MNQIAKGKKTADKIDSLYTKEKKQYAPDAYRMRFTSNHDENSWNGTEYERLGDGSQAFAVLAFTFPGIPMIYSEQESAMNKRLRFFDKDTIPWGNYPLASFYSKLTQLKKNSGLLAAGRQIFVLLNLSPVKQTVELNGTDFTGEYTEIFSGVTKEWISGEKATLLPWQYCVFETR
ncbi:MAG: hypothetical protein WCI71_05660 [Bacteroidota bacterium]